MFSIFGSNEKEREKQGTIEIIIEKEKVMMELEKVDEVREILEKKYPPYGVIKSFIDHLASTEKVFILAGMKKFGGDEIMDMFIDSETDVMVNETGIEEDVFDHIKEEFSKTHKNVSDIHNMGEVLRQKYPNEIYNCDKFIEYLEDYLMMLLAVVKESDAPNFDLNKEKEKAIYKIMEEMAEHDKLEIEKLKEICEEFKDGLGVISV